MTEEARLQRLEDRTLADHELIHGGASVKWEQSIRGKLHVLMTDYEGREKLRSAGLSRFSRGEAVAFLAFGLIQTLLLVAVFVRTSGHG